MTTARPTRTLTEAPKGLSLYRISDGKIQTGREADGTLRDVPEIIGRVERVGIYRGTLDSGESYAKIEADVRLDRNQEAGQDGEVVSLSANPTSVAGFTYGLLLESYEAGEVFRFRANKAKKTNARGTYSTYTNADLDQNGRWMQIKVADEGTAPFAQKCVDLEKRLKSHPLFGDRPDRGNNADGSAWDALAEAVNGSHWPAFVDAVPEYTALAASLSGTTYKSEDDVPAAAWRVVVDTFHSTRESKKVPLLLRDKAPKAATTVKADEYDPFADS